MFLEQLTLTFAVIGSFMTALFILSVLMKRNDVADVAWGTGIFIVALTSYLTGPQDTFSTLLTILAGLWGLRLTLRIFLRNRKKSEDFRYKVWRDTWGKWFYVRSYFQVYILQGLLMVVVGYPFIHASLFAGTYALGAFFVVGLVVWCLGYFFEVIGDWQLDTFLKSKPAKGSIMGKGLWKYTRHLSLIHI